MENVSVSRIIERVLFALGFQEKIMFTLNSCLPPV